MQQRTNKSFTDVLPSADRADMKQRIAKTTDAKERAQLEAAHARHRGAREGDPGSRAQAAERDLHRRDDASQGRPRGAGALPRARPHRRRHDGLPARPSGSCSPATSSKDAPAAASCRISATRSSTNGRPASNASRRSSSTSSCPGHGAPLKERQQITDFQNYIRDLWRQARALRLQGVTAQQAVEKIDMSKFAAQYGLKSPRPDPRAVLRAYEILQIQMPM